MKRTTLAMALGLGLGLTVSGCGPTATPPASDTGTTTSATPETKPEAGAEGGRMGGPPPGGGGGSTSPASSQELKGMQTDSYRKMNEKAAAKTPGVDAGPSAEIAKKEADADKPKGDADKPKDDAPKTSAVNLSADEIAEIKKLPAADQDAALAQKICPVGEDDGKPNHLGVMGTPVKVEVNGKTAFVCCKSCVDDLKKEPEKYLSKIGK